MIQKACSCALVHKTLSEYIRELWFLKSKKSTCHDLLLQVRACSDSATLSGLAAVVVTKSAHFSIRFFPSAILTCSRVQAIIIASVIHQFIAGMFGIVWFLNQIIKLNLKPCRSEFLVSGSHPCWGTIITAAGFANSAIECNAAFVNVGRDVVLVAKKFIPKNTEVFVNYATVYAL